MRERTTILIPTLDEVPTIGNLIRAFKSLKFDNVLVIDGHSTDGTIEAAEAAGADVVLQDGKGKGVAVRQAFELIDTDFAVMIVGDGTYSPYEVFKLLIPVKDARADHTVGVRLCGKGALSPLHQFGNFCLNEAFRLKHSVHVADLCSGYRAFTKGCIKSFDLSVDGFEVEAEMTLQTLRSGLKLHEEYVTYVPRRNGEHPKLRSFTDGYRILRTVLAMPQTPKSKSI